MRIQQIRLRQGNDATAAEADEMGDGERLGHGAETALRFFGPAGHQGHFAQKLSEHRHNLMAFPIIPSLQDNPFKFVQQANRPFS